MSFDFNRRMLLRLGLGASAAFTIGVPALAQQRKLFGIKIPKEVADILPQKILSVAETADALIALEREADVKQLPKSLLQWDQTGSVSPDDSSFYSLVLPRLVALIDRSEFRNSEFADKAGGLLAQLHATQHEVPAGWRGFDLTPGFSSADANGALGPLSLDPQKDTGLPATIDLPSTPNTPPIEETPSIPLPGSTETEPKETLPSLPEKPKPAEQENKPMSRRRDFASLASEYARLFTSIEIRPERMRMANWHLSMLRNSRSRYEAVGDITGVPWYFIGITHGLEASFNFRAHLHNGDFPLSSRTRQVPSGRPRVWLPPADWASSARDALGLLGFTGQKDWSLERTLYRLEAYNGLGYRSYGVPTPYLWSFSNHYQSGKYVADGKWSPTARSQQCGAAVMLKMLSDAGEIKLAGVTPA
jgi:lysozyme family protein